MEKAEAKHTNMVTFRCTECGNTIDVAPDQVKTWWKQFAEGANEQWMDEGTVWCEIEGCGDMPFQFGRGQMVQVDEGHPCTMYLNLYGITDAYGGPEEGGWWYEQGVALGSIPLPATWEWTKTGWDDEGDVYGLRPQIKPVHREWAEQCFKLTHMNDTRHYRVVTESSMASDYPRNRPHYE